jgi:hypothetical protein
MTASESMPARLIIAPFIFVCITFLPLASLPSGITYAQGDSKVQNIDCKSVQEIGSPVEIDSAEAELEIDPFNTPVAARIYVSYQNKSSKELIAVKFRIQFLDGSGTLKTSFLAPDLGSVSPGDASKQKWRKEGIDPSTKELVVQVLQVEYSDGTTWSSRDLADRPRGTARGSNQE